jgi:hypothetical protein
MSDIPKVEASDQGRYSALRGFSSVLALAFIQFGLSLFLGFDENSFARLYLVGVRYIGLSQLIYVIPLLIRAEGRGDSAERNGIILGSAIVLMLNAMCWGSL